MSIVYPVRLRTAEDFIRSLHGSDRPLTASELLVIDEYALAMVDAIQEAWPVDTSTSRDAWAYEVQEAPGRIEIVIVNPVDYVQFVHLSGTSPDAPLWETLVPQVVSSYGAGLLAALRAEVVATEAEIARRRVQSQGGWLDLIGGRPRWLGGAGAAR